MLVLTILISMFLTAFVGIIVERVGYRPLREAPRASAAITGLMIGIILETFQHPFSGRQRLKFPQLIESTTYNIGGVYVTNKKIMIVLVSIGLMLALHQFISRTKWGMAMRAMAYDYVVVPLVGVPMNTHRRHDLCHRFRPGRRRRHPFRPGLSGAGSLHGGQLRMESVCGRHSRRAGIHHGGLHRRFYARFYRDHDRPGHQIVNRLFSLNIGSNLRDLIAYSIVLLILVFRPHGLFGQAYSAKLRL
jgi:branched-chain amino acid transport system permease protein